MSLSPKDAFELQYWTESPKAAYVNCARRYTRALSMWGIDWSARQFQAVLEIGCGPHGGMLRLLSAPVRVGVDPMWNVYLASKLPGGRPLAEPFIGNIERVAVPFEEYVPTQQFDLIVSLNALDHGEMRNELALARHISRMLLPAGEFAFHVHLRHPDQLNVGHDHVFDIDAFQQGLEEDCDVAIQRFEFDPVDTDARHYAAAVGVAKKRE